MTNKIPFPTANHRDHFFYRNSPFINSDHGDLPAIEWAFVIDVNQIPHTDHNDEDDDDFTPHDYYLQVAANGEIRGVTRDYDEHEEYFSVTAAMGDVIFLKAFSIQYPNLTPTLASLLDFRKHRAAKLREQLQIEVENFSEDDLHLPTDVSVDPE